MSKKPNPMISDEDAQAIIRHYEGQTEEQALAEDEAAVGKKDSVMIEVPINRLDEIRALLASPRHQTAKVAENRKGYGKK